MKPSYKYNALVLKVLDGDTCEAQINLGFDITVTTKIRFIGLDTPESRTRNLEEKEMGLTVKQYTKDEIESKEIVVDSIEWGKYAGRCFGRIYIGNKCINDEIIRLKLGYEYWGGLR